MCILLPTTWMVFCFFGEVSLFLGGLKERKSPIKADINK